jgi:hypothetical protein
LFFIPFLTVASFFIFGFSLSPPDDLHLFSGEGLLQDDRGTALGRDDVYCLTAVFRSKSLLHYIIIITTTTISFDFLWLHHLLSLRLFFARLRLGRVLMPHILCPVSLCWT